MTVYEVWESTESGYVGLVTSFEDLNKAYDHIDFLDKYHPGFHHYLVVNKAKDCSGYITACNACIKAGKLSRAKQAFDLAWKEYSLGNYTETNEKHLFILRNNFYPPQESVKVTEKAAHYEEAILARDGH